MNFCSKKFHSILILTLESYTTLKVWLYWFWRDYLKTNFDVKNIVSVNFRPKNSGWKRCSEIDYLDANDCYIEYANGEKKPIGIYYKAFLKNVINNKICLNILENIYIIKEECWVRLRNISYIEIKTIISSNKIQSSLVRERNITKE